MLVSFQCVFKLASTLPIRWLAKVANALDGGYAFPFGLCIRRRHLTGVPSLIIQEPCQYFETNSLARF